MWQMYVIFAFGQCEHVNSSMMSDYNGIDGYLQLHNILFCTVFALYLFGDYIARTATAQKGV